MKSILLQSALRVVSQIVLDFAAESVLVITDAAESLVWHSQRQNFEKTNSVPDWPAHLSNLDTSHVKVLEDMTELGVVFFEVDDAKYVVVTGGVRRNRRGTFVSSGVYLICFRANQAPERICLPPLRNARAGHHCFFLRGDIYVVAGYGGKTFCTVQRSVEIYRRVVQDRAQCQHEVSADMLIAVCQSAACLWKDQIFLFAGFTGLLTQSTYVQCFDTRKAKWELRGHSGPWPLDGKGWKAVSLSGSIMLFGPGPTRIFRPKCNSWLKRVRVPEVGCCLDRAVLL